MIMPISHVMNCPDRAVVAYLDKMFTTPFMPPFLVIRFTMAPMSMENMMIDRCPRSNMASSKYVSAMLKTPWKMAANRLLPA